MMVSLVIDIFLLALLVLTIAEPARRDAAKTPAPPIRKVFGYLAEHPGADWESSCNCLPWIGSQLLNAQRHTILLAVKA